MSKAASTDAMADQGFVDILKTIKEKETNLYSRYLRWTKHMPTKKISWEEKTAPGFKVSKGCYILLFGIVSKGDCQVETIILNAYHSANPHPLKGSVKIILLNDYFINSWDGLPVTFSAANGWQWNGQGHSPQGSPPCNK